MTVTVEVRGVAKSFGRTAALEAADLTAGPGVTGLLGPNGAGKTTLLRMLATVLAPDAGQLRLLGRDPAAVNDRLEIRRRLGYLPQSPGFHRGFTAFEFVDYVAILKEITNRRERHDEARRVLDLVGLGDVRDRKIRALSGGMRQRVGLAQALLGDPDLLVLDEPTVGLDPEQRLRFRDMISSVGEGRTVILSTHLTDDVTAVCAQVAVLSMGRTLFQGGPSALAATAAGRVWVSDERCNTALVSWRTEDGRLRHVGDAPADAECVAPTVGDAYLLLAGAARPEVAA